MSNRKSGSWTSLQEDILARLRAPLPRGGGGNLRGNRACLGPGHILYISWSVQETKLA
jgi:hypothetical protein